MIRPIEQHLAVPTDSILEKQRHARAPKNMREKRQKNRNYKKNSDKNETIQWNFLGKTVDCKYRTLSIYHIIIH